nr:hypothetical protein B0A51_00328 [Rachicladosporium sp. CCFEE 5018]
MPVQITAPSRLIRVTPLTGKAFQDFGQVIENPSTHNDTTPRTTVSANQGSASKVLDVTQMLNHYYLASSQKPARPVMNMFICKPRKLRKLSSGQSVLSVEVLERHPLTPQTFIPMGLDKTDKSTTYLVIVAPTLPLSPRSREAAELSPPYPAPAPRRKRSLKERLLGARPNPFTNDYAPSTTPPVTVDLSTSLKPKGPGLPDLASLRAFIARGDQAVTYGPGTWHAPMVVLGQREVEFVVVQHANGVAVEDCQEVEVVSGDGGGLGVVVEEKGSDGGSGESVKAKL